MLPVLSRIQLLSFVAVLVSCKPDPRDTGPFAVPADTDGLDSDEAEPGDADRDGSPNEEDCNDADPNVFPGAEERCDPEDVDEDCDGLADQHDPDVTDMLVLFTDADSDGFGDPATRQDLCDPAAGLVSNPYDCDDADPERYPDAEEVCDERDNDCNGVVDEADPGLSDARAWYADADGDGFGDAGTATAACAAPAGWVSDSSDCDDGAADAYPGAEEVCDGRDQDCDRLADPVWYADADGDGYGDAATARVSCDEAPGGVTKSGDCDDASAAIHPGASDVCDDGVDQDCDGVTDCDDEREASEADLVVRTREHSVLGGAIAVLPDAGGDGIGDLVIGASHYDDLEGLAFVVAGGASGEIEVPSAAMATLEGSGSLFPYTVFGDGVAGGDFDGDGLGDVVVTDLGAATFFPAPFTAAGARLTDPVESYLYRDVSTLGDADGDGVDDVGVGSDHEYGTGSLYVLTSLPTSDAALDTSASAVIVGDASSAYPFVPGNVGDLDGDGRAAVAIGVYASDRVYVFQDVPSGTVSTADADIVLTDGEVGNDVAGGDVDGDGVTDLVASAMWSSAVTRWAGSVYVVSGATARSGAVRTVATGIVDGTVAEAYIDPVAVGDVNADGVAELLIGADALDEGTTYNVGRVWMFTGLDVSGSITTDDASLELHGDGEDAAFGSDVALGDVDGDGMDDLVIGSAWYGEGLGVVYVFYATSL